MPIPDHDPLVVAPTPTPFREDGTVDLDATSRNVERWLATPLSGFVLGTANGEEFALSEDEKAQIVKTVSDAAAGARLIVAGMDVPSVSETLRLAERYAEAGADLVRVRIPRGLPAKSIEAYYSEVAGRSPLPVVVIHQTFGAHPAAPPEVIGRICELDNVFGYITDHDIRFEGWVRPHVPTDRRFWICNGGLLAYGMLLGANGACMWLGNVAPALCMDIVRAGYEGNFGEARRLQATASFLDREIVQFGVAGVKAALAMLGYEMSGPRAPQPDVTPEQRKVIENTLQGAGLLG
jgi:dihydrodipicolinate synthase/N-acetylneuraminate lyase